MPFGIISKYEFTSRNAQVQNQHFVFPAVVTETQIPFELTVNL